MFYYAVNKKNSIEESARKIEVNDDEHSLFMALGLIIVTYNAWNKTPESIYQIARGQ